MELRHIRYFAGLAETLHFSRAALQLHMTQPALSQAMRQLESEVGAKLLDRTTRQVTLTPAGQRLAHDARRILAAVEESEAAVRRIAAGGADVLRVGLTHCAAPALLPRVVKTLRATLPGVALKVRPDLLSGQIATEVGDGRIDVGIVRGAVTAVGLASAPAYAEELLLALPEDHPLAHAATVTLKDLRTEEFVLPGPGSPLDPVVRRMCAGAGFIPVESTTTDHASVAQALVAAGLGVAFLPAVLATATHPGVTFRSVPGAEMTTLSFVWRAESPTTLVSAALDALAGDGIVGQDLTARAHAG
ncbi:transcriptional regulator, LysR family [Xylanimonas cellulosilytica DSM 15894]|uniref:Transcriptional regulator, LysR family n=1 Tax=Xylanimonas cellulosilytica (strain DSM 15894 / JCM 12276 / CECT 5975 / KCTC 9989 / LMG 20990 / NBRC 107835 / XIL07) TaxID=446471 RepID=D1BTU3_XYLCX|nr:LysR substrate-binding domain-containing protein [Xylanimonas cellulosilytica]ACZ29107.1 transcriptional regulator, LysR family [Xylanimonas cellulosilytica DSM 15894]